MMGAELVSIGHQGFFFWGGGVPGRAEAGCLDG